MRVARKIHLPLLAVFCFLSEVSAQDMRTFELQPLSPRFWDLIDRNAKLETVATGFGFTEGPMWDPAGFLCERRDPQQDFSRVSRWQKGRGHWAERPRWQYL